MTWYNLARLSSWGIQSMAHATREWQLQDAKNRLSELIRRAREEGAQEITVRGEPAAYLISPEQFRKLPDNGEETSWVDRVLAIPGRGDLTNEEIDRLFVRTEVAERPVPDFGDD